VAFKIIEHADHVEFHVTGNQPTNHDHSLDESDANKRNSFLRGLLQKDIAKGYAPAAVIGSIRGDSRSADQAKRIRLAAAGGTYLSRQDVINSGASWRLANPNALFVSRDKKAKLNTSETLDHVRTRFFELSEFTDSLDSDEKERLLKRWEDELADFSSAFVGCSLLDWVNRENQVILF
jgi:hypothetical protein